MTSLKADDTKRVFVATVAGIVAKLRVLELSDPNGVFTESLRMLDRDASDYVKTRWASRGHAATVKQAVETLTEEVRGLIQDAMLARINHPLLGRLIVACVEAVETDVIVDPRQREFFEEARGRLGRGNAEAAERGDDE